MSLIDEARQISPELVALRHDLHRQPELGLHLPRTQERLADVLTDLPLELTSGRATTSITGVLRGGAPPPGSQARPTVLLRADMDALPVQERTGASFSSRVEGTMHACGHDLHMSMLVGAAQLLSARRDELAGDVVLMFQPGEEGHDGAAVMIDEGVLEASGTTPVAAYALHVFSSLHPTGRFVTRPGAMLAAQDSIAVTVVGEGGHGSAPYLAKDPVPAMAEMITALQTAITRRFDPFDPVVLTVGRVEAGTVRNVIPDTATFDATLRTFSEASRARALEVLPSLLHHIARAHGVEVQLSFDGHYPVTENDVDETRFATETITEVFGERQHTTLANPLGASEDFSRVLQRVPGSFIGLGGVPTGTDPRSAPFNHNPRAVFDDGALPHGAALLAELALRRLRRASATPPLGALS